MRPTDLQFRPLRERTPEPIEVHVTRSGSNLFQKFVTSKYTDQMYNSQSSGSKFLNNSNLNKTNVYFGQTSKRFVDEVKPSTFQMQNLGPGSYAYQDYVSKQFSKPCSIKYQQLSVGKALSGTGDYHIEEGYRIVYEPSYKDCRKKPLEYYAKLLGNVINCYDKEIVTNMVSSLEEKHSRSFCSRKQFKASTKEEPIHIQDDNFVHEIQESQEHLRTNSLDQNVKCLLERRKRRNAKREIQQNNSTQNVIFFMGSTMKEPQKPTYNTNSKTESTIASLHKPKNSYRVMAFDSIKESTYFQKSFMNPTESSTFQRTKPVFYDLEGSPEQQYKGAVYVDNSLLMMQRPKSQGVMVGQNTLARKHLLDQIEKNSLGEIVDISASNEGLSNVSNHRKKASKQINNAYFGQQSRNSGSNNHQKNLSYGDEHSQQDLLNIGSRNQSARQGKDQSLYRASIGSIFVEKSSSPQKRVIEKPNLSTKFRSSKEQKQSIDDNLTSGKGNSSDFYNSNFVKDTSQQLQDKIHQFNNKRAIKSNSIRGKNSKVLVKNANIVAKSDFNIGKRLSSNDPKNSEP